MIVDAYPTVSQTTFDRIRPLFDEWAPGIEWHMNGEALIATFPDGYAIKCNCWPRSTFEGLAERTILPVLLWTANPTYWAGRHDN